MGLTTTRSGPWLRSCFCRGLDCQGYRLASGGTDNHLVLWDLRPHGLTGSKVEKVCEAASISLNRNTAPGDASALSPGGVSIGAPAMTTRGCTTGDFKRIVDFLDRCAASLLTSRRKRERISLQAIPFLVEPFGCWASTVARLQETRRHTQGLAELGYFFVSVCSPHGRRFQPSVHTQSHGHPEHRRQDVHHTHLQLCSAVFCRGHGVGDSRNLGMSVVRWFFSSRRESHGSGCRSGHWCRVWKRRRTFRTSSGDFLEKGGRRRVDLLGAFTFARNDTILTNSSE